MSADIAIHRQHLQQLSQLLFTNALKAAADRGSYLRLRQTVHLGDRPKGQGLDQYPQRHIVMGLFAMFKIRIIGFPVQQRPQMFFQQGVDLLPAGCGLVIVFRRQIGLLPLAIPAAKGIGKFCTDMQQMPQGQLPQPLVESVKREQVLKIRPITI